MHHRPPVARRPDHRGQSRAGARCAPILEGDFLGVGTTSNDNQSTSYIFRQRIALAEAETNSHWTFSGGQGWTLATENKAGITTAPQTSLCHRMIDPNYVAGLVWARMGNFRLTKTFKHAAFAVSAENPQLLYTASLAGNTPYAVVGSAGLSASLLNQAISACSPSTSIVNYTNQAEIDSAGNTVNSRGSGLQDGQLLRQPGQHLLQQGSGHGGQGRLRSRLRSL